MMVNRVTDCEVKAIKDVDFDTFPFITAANAVVNTINTVCGTSLTEAVLTQVELFLSAHFVGSMAPTAVSETFEGWSKTFMVGGTALTGVLSDNYGQTANMLSGGCLQLLDKQTAFGCSI
jgi:hypothetical protein